MQIKSDSLSKKQKRKKKKHDFTGNINPDNLIKKRIPKYTDWDDDAAESERNPFIVRWYIS